MIQQDMQRPATPSAVDTDSDERSSATDVVFLGIMNGLALRRFVPGQRLVEADLAVQFSVARNTVREALHRLAAEGIIEIVRHKGAVIRSLSKRETMDVLDVAERMMGLLARTAARSISDGQSGKEIKSALEQLIVADRAKDPNAFSMARRSYYRAMLEISGSRELRRLFPSIHMPIVYAQHRLGDLQKLRLHDYQLIGKAVLKGDEEGADASGVAHVRNVREEIMRSIDNDKNAPLKQF